MRSKPEKNVDTRALSNYTLITNRAADSVMIYNCSTFNCLSNIDIQGRRERSDNKEGSSVVFCFFREGHKSVVN